MSRASQHYPARLKATLTNFRSYCQKTSSSLMPNTSHTNFNNSITKYKSYREMKLMTQKNQFGQYVSSKNPNNCSPSKKEDSSLNFKQSELIDLIKHKLRQKNSFNGRIKTEIYDKEQTLQRKLQKKQTQVMIHYANTTKLVKGIKRKKIDLTVTNSKIGIYVKQERPQNRSKEVVIAIKQRPSSAIEYRTVYSPSKDKQPKLSSKHSAHITRQAEEPKMYTPQNNQKQRMREISGWEFQQIQQPFIEVDNEPTKKKSRRKRRLESKSKQK